MSTCAAAASHISARPVGGVVDWRAAKGKAAVRDALGWTVLPSPTPRKLQHRIGTDNEQLLILFRIVLNVNVCSVDDDIEAEWSQRLA